MDFGVSKHGDLLVGQGALRAVGVVAQPIVGFVVVFFGYLWFRLEAMEYMLWRRRVWEMLRMEGA